MCPDRQRRISPATGLLFLAMAAAVLCPRAPAADDLSVLGPGDGPRTMLWNYLKRQVDERLEVRRKAVAALKTPEAIRQRQAELRSKFLTALGDLPPKTPLNARVVGRTPRDGYSVERVIYESRPGHHVTANLYLPTGASPFPGVLVPCGHSANGKAAETYQRISILLAKNGMAALCYDPFGQGERIQALDAQGKPLIAGSTTEHTMAGIGALLVGRSAATYAIWDGIRSLDYLASRPEVDPARLGCTGNSGGGTLTAYLMALDDRIAAAVPSCYITSLERLFATIGPQDAEQNITGQVGFGMDHADYVIMRAPKPTMLSVGTQDYFDIQGSWDTFREVKLIYGRLGYGERVDLFESDEKHGYTQPRRQAAMRWLRRWLLKLDDAPVEQDFAIATDRELQCTETGQVLSDFHGKSVFDLNAEREAELARSRSEYQAKHSKEERLAKVRELIGLSQPIKPARQIDRGTVGGDGYTIRKVVFESEPGIAIPALLFEPTNAVKDRPLNIRVGLDQDTSVWLNQDTARSSRRVFAEQFTRMGSSILIVDLRGMGDTAPETKGPFGADWKEAFLGIHLGRPLLGQRVGDLLAIIAALEDKTRDGVALLGTGSAAPIALHAAALEPRIVSLNLLYMTSSWSDVVRSTVTRDQLASALPGVLAYYDLPDLAAMIAPRPMLIRGVADPAGESVPQDRIDATYSAARQAYAKTDGSWLKLEAAPRRRVEKSLVRSLDLTIGETQTVELSGGKTATVKLLAVNERRDPIRQAVREAKVTVEVNGKPLALSSGNYNLPVTVAGVQVDCPITGGYRSNSGDDPWGLEKDARIRLWPEGSPWIEPERFLYPARQRWFASSTQMANEPTYVDGGEKPSVTKIYYHNGLDIGGAEGLVEVVAATDGLVVSAGTNLLTGFKDTPARPRYDVVYLRDDRGWYYRYSHLQTIDPPITPGATVRMGQKIGVLGKEGGSGGWSHLHFEITSRQPSGKWGTQEGYAFLWQAIQQEQKPEIVAVARPHRLTWAGEPVVLDAEKSWSRSGEIASFEWTFSDGTTAAGPKVGRTYDRPGAYSEVVKVTDRQGHVGYDFAIVQVLDRSHPEQIPPTIHAAYAPTFGIKPGAPVTFKVRTFRSTDGQETWDFGDGSPAVQVQSDGNVDQHAKDGYAVTVHRYEKPGQYLVRVERTDRRGAGRPRGWPSPWSRDPRTLTAMPLDPQVQDYLTKLAALGLEPMVTISPGTARAMMEIETRSLGEPPAVGGIIDRSVPAPAGEIRIRITTPKGDGPFPALVFFHGGGWVVGSIATHDLLTRSITNAAHLAVVSVEYRLAPENRYPAAVEDAFAATAWVAANGASIGIDPARIGVGGDSAGGNLAAVVALMARDQGGPELAYQLLIYPITNDDLDTTSYRDYSTGYMLTREAMKWYWDQYVPEGRDRSQFKVSPLRAPDLSGLPRALVVTAEYDVLRDEAEAYAVRLQEAGVAARLIRYDGLIHGFLRRTAMFDKARMALAEIAEDLRRIFNS